MQKNKLFSWRVWSFGLALLVLEVCFVNLALWQGGKFLKKQETAQEYGERLKAPIMPLVEVENTPPTWQRVQVQGRWQIDDTIYITNQRLKDRYAVRVFTPMQVGEKFIWVDRGLMLHTPNTLLPKAADIAPQASQVSGILLAPAQRKHTWGGPSTNTEQREFLLVDFEQMPSPETGMQFPLYVQTDTQTHPSVIPTLTVPNSGAGQHLNYFITWALLVLLTPVLGVSWLRRGGSAHVAPDAR